MKPRIKVLVFPCGSECGLEIGRSLAGLKEIELWGGASVDDHGKFAYENYVGGLPFLGATDFFERLNAETVRLGIDCIYPALDNVVKELAEAAGRLAAGVVGSSALTAGIAYSKKRTYEALRDVVRCPRMYAPAELSSSDYPVFLKPEIGCGSRGVALARNAAEVAAALRRDPSLLVLENLPGEEYTVDCFTDFNGVLQFAGPRLRRRIARGISVNTVNVQDTDGAFGRFAAAINGAIRFDGAWFFQVKRAADGELTLMEIAPRIAGSMGLQRCRGVNLPLLSVLNQQRMPVGVQANTFDVEYDRAFYNRVRLSVQFDTLYLDFDDCLVQADGRINADILKLIGQYRNRGRRVVLISRHQGDLEQALARLGLRGLLDEVVHLKNGESKALYLHDRRGILMDDSFKERQSAMAVGVAALGPESVEALLN